MKYSIEIAKAIRRFLDENEFSYHFDKETGVFRMPFYIHGCMIKRIDIKIIPRKVNFILFATLPIGPDKENISLMNEFLARANFGMTMGSFEMDCDDGQINFKVSSMADEESAEMFLIHTFAVMHHSILIYGDGIVNISAGRTNNPKAECERLESISEERDLSRTLRRKLMERLLEIHDDSDKESNDSDEVDVDDEDAEQGAHSHDSGTEITIDPDVELLFKLLSDNDEDTDE